MDSIKQYEELRKGIRWDGDSVLEFEYEKGDEVHELLKKIEKHAEKSGITVEEMVNSIIWGYLEDCIKQQLLEWIRMMEWDENNRMREFKLPEPQEGNLDNRDPRGEVERTVRRGSQTFGETSGLEQNLFLENGEAAGLLEVCHYFIDHYPEDIYIAGSDHPVSIMRNLAKEIITDHEMREG